MGYILPVTHYTYHQYQHRLIESKKNPHFVEAPYRVSFHHIKDTYKHPKSSSFERILTRKQRQMETDSAEAVNTKLEGKGKKVNEWI